MARSLPLPALVGIVLAVGACSAGAIASGTAPATGAPSEPIVIKTRVLVAAEPGAEPIATGEVQPGSTLAGAAFCAGGTVVDSHGSGDPSLRLIVETITCPDGTLSLAFAPDLTPLPRQTGLWVLVGGSGAYEGLRGSGTMEAVYGPTSDSPVDVTFTGAVSR